MLPKIKDLNLVTPEDFNKRAKDVFGEKPESQPENETKQSASQSSTKPKGKGNRLTWKTNQHHELFKQFQPPHWLLPLKDDTEVTNYIYCSLSFFISSTISRPNPVFTWLDILVPDQLQDRLQAKKIMIDGSIPGKIFLAR